MPKAVLRLAALNFYSTQFNTVIALFLVFNYSSSVALAVLSSIGARNLVVRLARGDMI